MMNNSNFLKSLHRLISPLAFASLGVSFAMYPAPTAAGVTVPTPIALTLGEETHAWDTLVGGVIWLYPKSECRLMASVLPELPGNVLVNIKANGAGFGYRFDLNFWEPTTADYSRFVWDGGEGQPPNLDELFQIFGGANVKFVLNVPLPLAGTDDTYSWQTAEFYAAQCQYLFGPADDANTYQTLADKLDFFTQPATFNWANLRARRGHPEPYSAEALILGEDPYNIEGWNHDGAGYGAMVEACRQQLRLRGIHLSYGVCLADSEPFDSGELWLRPMIPALSPIDPPTYFDLFHFHNSDINPDFNRSAPVALNDAGFNYWWVPASTWTNDYTRYLWMAESDRKYLSQLGLTNQSVGWSEHAILFSSKFRYNDMDGALHWANWLTETVRLNTQWDSMWCLGAHGDTHALVQVVNGIATRTPGFYVYRLAMPLHGNKVLAAHYEPPMGHCLNNLNVDVHFPWCVVQAFKDPRTGRLSLFVVNQNATNSYQITGLESYHIAEWHELSGATYAAGNALGIRQPETVREVIIDKDPSAALVFRPVSVTRVDFAPTLPKLISGLMSADGFRLNAMGIAGQTYDIEMATSLSAADWAAIGSVQAGSDGTIQFLHTASVTDHQEHYYRLHLPE